ncbi:MAG: hypothetical protein GWN07_36500, partial [Actinobacteria bacterium]|nr:hypothetical protein [Actinomycetota bacterium]NIS36381.1 hypothetical protein [Actinomycetota bacterium]NIU70910.1 hypothetical protein [Actinomycetota bacterium]NIW32835.1 hypothetical protein [Actinomycetota bacterium]NIX25009.1 hypothetical protein [Actinomycetota bacterium]
MPGFTFTRVGEFPSAIAVREEEPGVTYVASFGSRAVEWYPTGIFVDSEEVADTQGEVALPAGPTDLVIAPGVAVAYTVLPAMGLIVPLPIQPDRSLLADDPMMVMDGAVAPTVPVELPAPTAGMASDYGFFCAPEGEMVSPGTPPMSEVRTEALESGETAQPHRLLVVDNGEGVEDELLVADRELPLIYRFTIGADGTLTEQAPLAPGVPIRDLAVSPFVSATAVGGMPEGSVRYLYAIDDTDQSVLVMDYSDPASADFG